MALSKDFIPYGRQKIDDEDVAAVVEVLKSDWLTTGPKIEEFEKKMCEYTGAKYAIAVNSGTSALDIAVAALGIPPGSEVITTPFTFVATSNCILYNECKPVFADIRPDTYNIDPKEIRKKITEKTKAIICVDFAGCPCDMDEIKKVAEDNNLSLVEDAAHALGAKYRGKRVGSFADITEFSFHPVKHITTGEGGVLTTDDEEIAKKLRALRNHGMDRDARERFGPTAGYAYDINMLGRNYRITDMQCALGISQMNKLEGFLKRRKEIVKRYNERLQPMEGVKIPHEEENSESAWHLYTILLDKEISRDKVFALMRERKIGVNVHYIPIYKFTYYRERELGTGEYPVTEDVFSRILTLPLHQCMDDEDVERVITALGDSIRKAKADG